MSSLIEAVTMTKTYSSSISMVVTATDKATRSLEIACSATESLTYKLVQFSGTSTAAAGEVSDLKQKIDELNQKITQMGEKANSSKDKVTNLFKKLGKFDGKKLFEFGKDSFGESNAALNAEAQLKVILANTGAAEGAYDRLSKKAAAIQGSTIYTDTSMLAGAGKLAANISDPEAVEHMMGTLSNYAAGMSGGGEVDSKTMAGYADQLSKAFDGDFKGLEGFELTEAQQKIIANGSEMEKALVIDDVVNQSWAGLAESMASLPQNSIIRLNNSLGDIKEKVGNMLTPAIMRFVQLFQANLPTIESLMLGLGIVMGLVADGLGLVAEGAMNVAGFFVDNWGVIAPIIFGLVAALIAYNAVMGIGWLTTVKDIAAKVWKTAVDWAQTAATIAMTAAQSGLNAALAACPITWIIILVIALITVIVLVCNWIAKTTDIANTGFGVITGGINVVIQFFKNLLLTVANIALGIHEVIGALCENIMAAFHNAFSSVKSWWYGLLSTALTVIDGICEALNNLPFVDFDYSGISSAADEYAAKAAKAASDKKEYTSFTDAFSKGINTFDTFKDGWMTDAFNDGSDWGDSKIDKLKNLIDTSGFKFDPTGLDGYDRNNYEGLGSDGSGYGGSGFGGSDLGTSGNPATVNGTGAGGSVKVDNEEDIEWMRKLAERDYVARVAQNTLAPNIKVEFTGPITKTADVDGVAAHLGEILKEQIATAPEGVYA